MFLRSVHLVIYILLYIIHDWDGKASKDAMMKIQMTVYVLMCFFLIPDDYQFLHMYYC